jgi:isocitrate dehydrogenase
VAAQTDDPAMATQFLQLASTLAENESKIVGELSAVQGQHVDAINDACYYVNLDVVSEIMRPSETLNASLDNFSS